VGDERGESTEEGVCVFHKFCDSENYVILFIKTHAVVEING